MPLKDQHGKLLFPAECSNPLHLVVASLQQVCDACGQRPGSSEAGKKQIKQLQVNTGGVILHS